MDEARHAYRIALAQGLQNQRHVQLKRRMAYGKNCASKQRREQMLHRKWPWYQYCQNAGEWLA
jgi:hypothetical protein